MAKLENTCAMMAEAPGNGYREHPFNDREVRRRVNVKLVQADCLYNVFATSSTVVTFT